MFKQMINSQRTALGWSVSKLANEARVDRARLNQFLNGKATPPRGVTLEKLLKALGFKSMTFKVVKAKT